jgi:outer membrane protein TolC
MVILQTAFCFAEGTPTALTLEEYTRRAIKEGVSGRQTDWVLEQAGYARDVVMRQTAYPTLSAQYDHIRSEAQDNVLGTDILTDTNRTTLNLAEQTPLGTQINASSQYGSSTEPSQVGRPNFAASLTQPLYVFVKNDVARRRLLSDLDFATAKNTYQSTLLNLRTLAHSDYYAVVLGEESVKVEERQLASLQKLVDVTKALVDAGKAAPVELMRAKIRLQVEQSQLDNVTAQRDQAILNAKNFAFMPLDAPVNFITQLEFAPFQIPLDRLIDYALLHQPALESRRHSMESKKLLYDASVEPTRPTLSLNGTYNDNQYRDILLTHGWSWTGTAKWTFFDAFVTQAKAKSARIDEWVADLNLSDAERTTRVKVHSSFIDIKNTEKQIEYFKFSLDQARRNVEVERLRFQNGLAQLTDVFDSENELRSLDNQYLSLLVKFNQSKDNLSELIGADVETLQ